MFDDVIVPPMVSRAVREALPLVVRRGARLDVALAVATNDRLVRDGVRVPAALDDDGHCCCCFDRRADVELSIDASSLRMLAALLLYSPFSIMFPEAVTGMLLRRWLESALSVFLTPSLSSLLSCCCIRARSFDTCSVSGLDKLR